MAGDKNFDVKANPYQGIDVEGIAKEELFKAATRGLTGWKDNLSTGVGERGTRQPWVNTGEARANLAMQPATPTSLNYEVFGTVFQLFVAEFGRAPNNTMPPAKAIEDWVAEKRLAARGSPDFTSIVFAIRAKIARDGIKPFAPALKAGNDSQQGFEAAVQKRLEAEKKAAWRAADTARDRAGQREPKTRT